MNIFMEFFMTFLCFRSKLEDFLRTSEEIGRLDLPFIESGSDATIFDYLVDKDGQ